MKPEIVSKIEEGKTMLDEYRFPGDIIESIEEKRVRRSVTKEIFGHLKGYTELSNTEKEWRDSFLRVQFAFINYMTLRNLYRSMAILMLLTGFVSWATAFMQLNNNMLFGTITFIEGIILFYLSFNTGLLVKTLSYQALGLTIALLIELLFLGLPEAYIQYITENLDIKFWSGSLIDLANRATAYLYLILKIVVCGFILIMLYRRKKYENQRIELKSIR